MVDVQDVDHLLVLVDPVADSTMPLEWRAKGSDQLRIVGQLPEDELDAGRGDGLRRARGKLTPGGGRHSNRIGPGLA